MRRIDRILSVIDPTTEDQPALAKAAELAVAFDAYLELFACDFDPALASAPLLDTPRLAPLREKWLDRCRRLVHRHAEPLRAQGLKVEIEVRWAHPVHRSIVERIQETRPGLVVKDTHHHGPIRRTLLSNTDWSLIRTCPVPLLLAKRDPWKRPPVVVAALDPGHLHDKPDALDDQLLDYGALLASRFDGALHAVHAFSPAALIAVAALVDSERERRGEILSLLAAKHGLPPDRVHISEGPSSSVLVDAVDALDASVVVMGAISRSHLKDVVIGSTAERVLDRIGCDVLIVKPPA